MNINKLFLDKNYLENQIEFFIENKQIKRIEPNPELVQSHIQKAKHNLGFFKLNKVHEKYKDWQIVALYYALYHASLALITNKNYSSKNHYDYENKRDRAICKKIRRMRKILQKYFGTETKNER